MSRTHVIDIADAGVLHEFVEMYIVWSTEIRDRWVELREL